MSTLFARLTSPPLVFTFAADLALGDPILTNVSDTSALLVGMPMSGRGLQAGTTLLSLDPVTLSNEPTVAGTQVTLTQGIAQPLRIMKPLTEFIGKPPAMCLVEGAEIYPSATGGDPKTLASEPQIVTLHPYLWIYASANDPAAVPNSIMNVLLDAVDKAILPRNGRSLQNLGLKGVQHCRIEGQATRSPGIEGAVAARVQFVIQAMAAVDTVPL
jgi:hypothetical protein